MEFYDDLMLDQYDPLYFYKLFKEYYEEYGLDGLIYLQQRLDSFLEAFDEY